MSSKHHKKQQFSGSHIHHQQVQSDQQQDYQSIGERGTTPGRWTPVEHQTLESRQEPILQQRMEYISDLQVDEQLPPSQNADLTLNNKQKRHQGNSKKRETSLRGAGLKNQNLNMELINNDLRVSLDQQITNSVVSTINQPKIHQRQNHSTNGRDGDQKQNEEGFLSDDRPFDQYVQEGMLPHINQHRHHPQSTRAQSFINTYGNSGQSAFYQYQFQMQPQMQREDNMRMTDGFNPYKFKAGKEPLPGLNINMRATATGSRRSQGYSQHSWYQRTAVLNYTNNRNGVHSRQQHLNSRPQAQSVLAVNNLNSKPKVKDQHVSIEDVIRQQIEKKKQAQRMNQTFGGGSTNFVHKRGDQNYPAAGNISHQWQLQTSLPQANEMNFEERKNPFSQTQKRRNQVEDSQLEPELLQSRRSMSPSRYVDTDEQTFQEILDQRDFDQRHKHENARRQQSLNATSTLSSRGGESTRLRQQFKLTGYDPKAQMVAQTRKDLPHITEMLQYKDYVMDRVETYKTGVFQKQNRGKGFSTRQSSSPNNHQVFSAQSSRSPSNDNAKLAGITPKSQILKNSFKPPVIPSNHIGPVTTVKITDKIKNIFSEKGQPDKYRQLTQSLLEPRSREGSREPNFDDILLNNQDQEESKERKKAEHEYLIKNYRVVCQKKREFLLPVAKGPQYNDQQLQPTLYQDEKGTAIAQPPATAPGTIRVSNSILSPNTFHFSTKVTIGRNLVSQEPEAEDELPQQAKMEPTSSTELQEPSSVITPELTSPQSPRAYLELLQQKKSPASQMHEKPQDPKDDDFEEEMKNAEQLITQEEQQQPKSQPIKILDTQDYPTLEDAPPRIDIVEENYKDIIASWLGPRVEGVRDKYIESEDENDDEDWRDMKRDEFSAVKIYDLNNSFDSYQVEQKMIMKMTPWYQKVKEEHMQDKANKQKKEPYAHLKARNVFGKKVQEFNQQIELVMQNPDSRTKAKIVIELSKDFLTHMDYSQFSIDRLPLEIFDDFLQEAESIKQKIDLRKSGGKSPLRAKTKYYKVNGSMEEVKARVLDYDDSRRKFIVEFKADGQLIRKQLGRLALVFDDFDSKEHIEERRNLAKKLRRHTLFKLNAERLFIQELARKYDYIKMPYAIKQNIKSKLNVDLKKYDSHKVQVLALQVEALFVFSILKSVIYSQIGDPFISRIVAQYKVEEMTLTKKDVKDEIADTAPSVPYYALKAYEENGGKFERMLNKDEARLILQDYAILGKKSFIEAMQFLIQQNEDLVQATPLFHFPVSDQKMLIFLQTTDEFKNKSLDQLKDKLRVFPVLMPNFIKSQRIIAKRFKDTLEGRWTENITRKVEKIVALEFQVNSGLKEILRSQINPYLLKLFELIRITQEKNLLDKLIDTLHRYLDFIMQFAIRNEEFIESKAFKQKDFQKLKVKMSSKAMITVEVRVKKTIVAVQNREKEADSSGDEKKKKSPRESVANEKMFAYEIITQPALEDVWTDFNSMIDMFVNSVSRIRRIDELVITQLKLKRNTLMQFDRNKNQKVLHLSKMITTIIDVMRQAPDSRVLDFTKYTPYLEMTFDQMILDLKMKTYLDQHSSVDDGEQTKRHQADDDEEGNEKHSHDIEDYKDVEITEPIYQDKFAELRSAYWDVLQSIDSQYDYGLIVLDCTSFKSLVAKHLDRLLKLLEKHIVSEFLEKMNKLYNQYELVEKKATDKASTIDDVILLIEFIENIQKPDELLDDLEQQMEELKQRKNFIDDLYLRLEGTDFEKYLHLFSFPSQLRLLLVKRKFSLEKEREFLSAEMAKERDKVLKAIIHYRECFEYFKKVGLYKPGSKLYGFPNDTQGQQHQQVKKPETKNIIKKRQTTGSGADSQNDGSKSRRGEEGKRNSIVSLQDEFGNQFVPQYISENGARMEKLKADLEATEQECEIINRREKLLNFRITKFTAVSNLKADMSPFVTLWSIAQSFTKVYEHWLHGSFADLDSDSMDEMLQDWIKQLTRISKTNLATYDQPLLLVNYLLRELEKFKEYMPMIAAMRAKGLEKRHWNALSKQLGFESVDTNSATLAHLIDMKLHEGPQLEIIKAVCEVAMREWAIKTTLDSLDSELKNVEFTVAKYKEQSGTFVLKGLEELMVGFEEFTIKVVGLKTNAFSKPFAERIGKVEREFRTVVDVLDEWILTQKSWIYLEPIFSQKDLAKQMAQEATKFNQLDSFYRKEINTIRHDPQVHKYCRREHILTSLQYVNREFENISKGLTVYLESKREHFARFYFLSNEEIIEILGQMRDPRNVQRYLNKIFEGIESLQFNPYGMIAGIFSKEEEFLALRRQINPTDTAESWLKELETEMKVAVKYSIQSALIDFRMKDFESWVKAWQGQAVLVVLNIIFTDTLSEIFEQGQIKRMKDVLNQVVFEIETLTKMIRSKVDYNTRTSICSLIINRVHARDTLKHMLEIDVREASDFYWRLYMKYEYVIQPKRNLLNELRTAIAAPTAPAIQNNDESQEPKQEAAPAQQQDQQPRVSFAQLKLRLQQQPADAVQKVSPRGIKNPLEGLQELCVCMIDARKPYGYEYLGNTQRLVITPLTDRCFRALFMALHFNYGGSPEGPVGTGKTETTKDLSKCMGKQCFVFNCSSSLNYEAMSKFFKGLATSGAWSCFDEFNRIDLAVLSVISQIIIVMQSAIRENKSEVFFDELPIKFNKECAIFITMNPQFLGRTDLPDNLKSLFRPVSMIVPDSTLISEIHLYSSGFLQAKHLARKLVLAFKLAKQQLSHQIHYEFGLRSIKIVLQIAGLMKLKASGVIEPDFKIKEGKKNKTEENESPTKKDLARQNRMASKEKSKKKSELNNRAAYLNFMRKQESSLDSEDMIRRKRNASIDSDDLNINDDTFFRAQVNPQAGTRIEDIQDEEREQHDHEKTKPDKIMDKYKMHIFKTTKRGLDKFHTKRRPFARGQLDLQMDRRLEALEGFKDQAKSTKKMMKVLGIDDEELIKDENKVEEFIVLRAINETNIPKLHQNDTTIFKGIIDDIFPDPIRQNSKRSSLKSLLEDVVQGKTMQMTEEIMDRILHLYETVMIRHGVMVVGATMTGKTTGIQLLQECLNRSRENEMEERVQEFKLKKAKKLAMQNFQKKQWAEDTFDQDEMRALSAELTFEELKLVRAQCRNKGVATFTINPKSLTTDQLMGRFDENSHDWNDGIMAHAMRTCSQDTSERRNWIVFDGPIDPVWVENLNSVLDDNKKLTLSTGESIKMTGLMTVILEAEDLSNCTPATISRCGMIYMKDDILPLKAIINQWIKRLPIFLEDMAQEVDHLTNYFLPEILEKYMTPQNLIYPVTQKWAVKNFTRMMDAMINDYRSDKFNQLNTLNAAALALYTGNPNEVVKKDSEDGEALSGGGDKGNNNSTDRKRPFYLQFSDVESRFQSAFRNKMMWIQNFFLFSLVWSFGSILQLNLRSDFEKDIKSKVVCNTEDISTIAQLKSKFLTKKQGGGGSTIHPPAAAAPSKPGKGGVKLPIEQQMPERVLYNPTTSFKAPERPPYFICMLPTEHSLFDLYFDLESNSWYTWDTLKISNRGGGGNVSASSDSQPPSSHQKQEIFKRTGGSVFTQFIPTVETIRLSYLLEANLVCRNNVLFLGPTGCGKSWLVRETLFKQLPSVSSRYKSSSIVYSSGSTAEKAQHFIDLRLERRRKGVFGPPFAQKYIFFIDDLMMPFKDEFGTQQANELLRQWFDFGGWFDPKSLEFKRIEDIQFVSAMTIYDATKTVISTRNEWHWTYIGAVNMDEKHYLSMFSQILEHYAIHWPACVQGNPMRNVIWSTLELYAFFEKQVKPTPSKYLYHFNIRHMFKIIYGVTEVDPTYLRSEFDLAKLWIHESWRTLCDRICDIKDQKLIYKKMQDIAKKMFKMGADCTFSKLKDMPYFSPYNKGAEGLYIEAVDFQETTAYFRKYLAEYNEQNKKARINVVIFDFLAEFLLKVLRVIKQPFSHAILMGIEGSGKQAICHLATVLAGFQFHTIRFDAHYSQEDWQFDLKHLLQVAGLEMKEIVFHLKHNQIVKESFLDDLNTLVNNGEVQNVFSKEDYENIVQQVQARLIAGSNNSVGAMAPPDKANPQNSQIALGDFSQRCRENLKIVLNFTPSGANLRQRVRDYKQLVNCSTVIWMDNWPSEGYKEVAEILLPVREASLVSAGRSDNQLFSLNRDEVLEIAMKIHMDAIKLAKQYFFETQHFLHITPHLFSDFLNAYKQLFNEKRMNLNDMRKRYETGLDRLQRTQEQVEEFSNKLESSSPILIDKQIEVEKLLERLKEEQDNVARVRDMLTKEEEQLTVQREQAELIKEECEHNLQNATPELFAAVSALQSLSKIEINELKALKNPPQAVKLLMEGVCLVMGVEPIRFKAKDGVTILNDYWSASTGKSVLGNARIVEILSALDSTTITTETMTSLEELTQNPEFSLDTVAKASKAGKGLFLWLQAIKNYYYVYQETIPKRDALFYAEKQMIEKEQEIKRKQVELVELQQNLEYLKASHKTLESDITVLQKQIDECSVKKERAGKLLTGLGGERQKWLVCNRMIEKKFLTIQGDVLLGAAFITYLSGFTQKFRERSVDAWALIIKRHGISITDDFSFNKTFGDQIKIKEWIFNGLPGDSFSIQNAVILEKCSKQPICIDPQYQANKWIKMQDAKDLKILNFTDSNFVQSLEFAMKFGKRVLLENVGQKIDLMIYPLIKKEFINESGSLQVQIFGHQVEIDPNFKMFIVSEFKNPRFGPDISVLTTQVNFHVTIEGLEEQMLSIVITHQKSELEEESIKMRKEALQCIKILKKLEDDILESLSKDIDSILADEKLIETLNTSKKTSRQIGENLQRVNRATMILLKSRGIYTPAAYRAAILYFLVSDIAKIEYMYQFSLKWYIDIFTEEVKSKKHTDQDPLLDIIRNFTYTLYRRVCQSIFEKDKLLFTFLLAFRILEGERCLDEKLFEFFLHGQIKVETVDDNPPQEQSFDSRTKNMTEEEKEKKKREIMLMERISQISQLEEKPKEDPELKKRKRAITWINDHQWQTLENLSQIPPFNKPNIVKHILDNSEQWLAYVNAKDSDNLQMPGPYIEYDPAKEARRLKRLQCGGAQLDGINEEEQESENNQPLLSDDEIWDLDDEDEDEPSGTQDGTFDGENIDSLVNNNKAKKQNQKDEDTFQDDRELFADSIVSGVSDYNEVRYGSIRFEKELMTKKQQVLKDLIRFSIIRIFMPEKIVREVQRFLGSVLDPRFMEPPVFNLPQFYQETSCFAPVLFIQSQNTNVLNELNILKLQINEPQMQIDYMPLGGNINEKAQQLILKCATNGNWLLLENLHLVTEWISSLEKYLQELYKEDKKEAAKNAKPGRSSKAVTSLPSKEVQTPPTAGQPSNAATAQTSAVIAPYPELVGIRIHPKFRLWLASMPVDYFPVSFLQDCVKLTLQPAQGIRQNALKILNSTSYDFLYRCSHKGGEFRKLFYALTIFHAVVVERQRFGPLGFSAPYYNFSESDFVISSLQLQDLASRITNDSQPLPLELARYLIGTLNYGGRIIKAQDEVTLNALLDTFLNERTCTEPNYRLTGDSTESGIYYVPGDGDINHYKMFIAKFPIQDRPEIFGLHRNAIIQRMTHDGKGLLERVFEFEFASKEIMKATAILETNDAGVEEQHQDDKFDDKTISFKKRIVSIIKELPDLLDEQLCSQLYPISYDHCFNTMITKEVQRYNILMQVIYVSLKNTLKALDGIIHINPLLEEVHKSLTYEHVPRTWYRYSYPAFKSLSLFLSNLKERVEFIRSFLIQPSQNNNVQTSGEGSISSIKHKYKGMKQYWLPGFYDQQSFLTMLLQQKARNEKVSIEMLAINYKVARPSDIEKLKEEDDGCLINGLFLEGARWVHIEDDKESITLQDQLDGYGIGIYQEMPYFHLTIIPQQEYEDLYMNDKYYQCPLYMIGLREKLDMTQGDNAAFSEGLITKIPLYIGASGVQGSKNAQNLRTPGFWTKRGTALLCHVED